MTKVFQFLLVLQLLAGIFWFKPPVFADTPDVGPKIATDRIIVKYKAGVTNLSSQRSGPSSGGAVIKQINRLNAQVVQVPAGQIAAQIQAYQKDSSVEYVEPDYIVRVIDAPNDTYFGQQWGLTKIKAQEAWNYTTGNSSVKVAILDTGIDQDHPDLASRIVANQNLSSSATIDDLYGHGTHVAGIVAALTNNGIGVAGVGYNTSLMNVKVMDDTGNGFDSDLASGIIWAADNGAKVINMSLGGADASITLENAVNYAWNKGVVLVASAGNNGNSQTNYPAYYTNCIAVAATDQNDAKSSFSTYGSWVDVAAPGSSILSTLPNHANYVQQHYGAGFSYGLLSGTSMAAPFSSGLAALIWATQYGTSAFAVRSRIENTADAVPGTGVYWQNGRINAYKAVSQAGVFTFSGFSPSIQAGSVNTFVLTANDELGATIQGYRGTVHFASTDALAALPADYTFVLSDNGTHNYSVTFNTAGIQSVSAVDIIDGSVNGIRGNILVKAITSTALSSSGNASAQGQSITFVASVTSATPGAGIPDGLVTFQDGTIALASVSLNASGQAVYATAQLPVGIHNISGIFTGGMGYITCTSSVLIQNVCQAWRCQRGWGCGYG